MKNKRNRAVPLSAKKMRLLLVAAAGIFASGCSTSYGGMLNRSLPLSEHCVLELPNELSLNYVEDDEIQNFNGGYEYNIPAGEQTLTFNFKSIGSYYTLSSNNIRFDTTLLPGHRYKVHYAVSDDLKTVAVFIEDDGEAEAYKNGWYAGSFFPEIDYALAMDSVNYAGFDATMKAGAVWDGPLMITAGIGMGPFFGWASPNGQKIISPDKPDMSWPISFGNDLSGFVEVYLPRSTFGIGLGAGIEIPDILYAAFDEAKYVMYLPYLRASIIPFNKPGGNYKKLSLFFDYYITDMADYLFKSDLGIPSSGKDLFSKFGVGIEVQYMK
jgi:hypothetical protein